MEYDQDTEPERMNRAFMNLKNNGGFTDEYKEYVNDKLGVKQNSKVIAIWTVNNKERDLWTTVTKFRGTFNLRSVDGASIDCDIAWLTIDSRRKVTPVIFLDDCRYYDIRTKSIISYYTPNFHKLNVLAKLVAKNGPKIRYRTLGGEPLHRKGGG
jgi:hypothetical protein